MWACPPLLQVRITERADQLVIAGTLGGGVCGKAVGDVGVFGTDIDMVKEIGLHEVAVALIVSGLQAPH